MENIGIISLFLFSTITVINKNQRSKAFTRTTSEWIIDLFSLGIHFIALPFLQSLLIHQILHKAFPSLNGSLQGSISVSTIFYLIICYAGYWNHRLLHAQTPLWSMHSTHHSSHRFDVFITARNSIFSHFFMVYFWLIGLAIFLLDNPNIFLTFTALGLVINLWTHTDLNFKQGSLLERMISSVFITPRDHSWHHSRENSSCNFGSVFILWDQLHSTLYRPKYEPKFFGDDIEKTIWNQLIYPFKNQ